MLDTQTILKHRHFEVIIVGGGQAALSLSFFLTKKNISHLVIEKNTLLNAWKQKRWDSFTLVTPNWQCQLPGHPYSGKDPNGFMNRTEIIDYLNAFIEKVKPPVIEGTTVIGCKKLEPSGFSIQTKRGDFTAEQVVVATGAYHHPVMPALSDAIDSGVTQIHSEQYKSAHDLAEGAVMVVGSGQSGAQIAEDLHLEGRQVYLATGSSPRCARFYRGRDVVDWLADMNYYDMPVQHHPLKEGVRDNSNHYVTGRDGGRDIDLRQFATEGMILFGQLTDFKEGQFIFSPSLKENLDTADATYNRINQKIDAFIEEKKLHAPSGHYYTPVWEPEDEQTQLTLAESNISTIIWCIGFKHDFSWIECDIFDERHYPKHQRGVTPEAGLYFLGLPWLHTWGSGRFSGIARDAEYIADQIIANQKHSTKAIA